MGLGESMHLEGSMRVSPRSSPEPESISPLWLVGRMMYGDSTIAICGTVSVRPFLHTHTTPHTLVSPTHRCGIGAKALAEG